jgi:hypothetical protein
MELKKDQIEKLSETLKSKEDRFAFFVEILNIFKNNINEKLNVNTNEIVSEFMDAPIGKLDFSNLSEEEMDILIQTTYNSFELGMLTKYLPEKLNNEG